MDLENMPFNETRTLAQHLSDGRPTVAEALRYAMQLGDSLRKLHDAGKAHGAVNPSNVVLTAAGVELLPAAAGTAAAITPYTAPEVVQGRPADARSDIFGFGAILFELLTGRRAFEGESRITLSANLTRTPAPSSGSPVVDRLVGPCLTKNPDARSSRMQMVMMELKLVSAAARRAETGAGTAVRRDTGEAARAEAQQIEARLASRLQAHEKALAEMHRSTAEAISSLKAQFAGIGDRPGAGIDNRGLEALNSRLAQIERTVEEMRQHGSQFENSVAADLVDIEQSMKTQSAAIESARTAMSQTDDLVERVVEALESLQTAVLDQADGGERPAFAVN